GPIVTAGLILQVLSGSKMINVDFSNPGDRALFTGASKVLSVFMTLFEGLAFLLGGAYNVTNSAGVQTPPSLQNEFFILVQLIIIYLNGLRGEVPVSYARYRGFRGRFPIKFFYVSNIPVIFAAALFGNIFFIGQLIFNRYNPGCSNTGINFWLSLIPGCYQSQPQTGQLIPIKGLAYYTFAPRSLGVVLGDPIRAGVYMLIFVLACVFFAVTWVEVGEMDS